MRRSYENLVHKTFNPANTRVSLILIKTSRASEMERISDCTNVRALHVAHPQFSRNIGKNDVDLIQKKKKLFLYASTHVYQRSIERKKIYN